MKKKKNQISETEETTKETTEKLDLDEQGEEDAGEETLESLEEEQAEAEMSLDEEEPLEEEKPKEKKPRKKRASKKPSENPVATVTSDLQQSLEAMEQVSAKVVSHYEKLASLVSEMPQTYADAVQQLAKQNVSATSSVGRLSVGMSAAAIVIALVGFLFSQSLRKEFLTTSLSAPSSLSSMTGTAKNPRNTPELARTPRSEDDSSASIKVRPKRIPPKKVM